MRRSDVTGHLELMRERSPVPLLTMLVAISLGILGWLGVHSYVTSQRLHLVTALIEQIQESQATIIHLNEVLTMSARMAAVTGDPEWVQRYQQATPELQQAIRSVRAFVPAPEDRLAAEAIAAARGTLAELEQQALTVVQQGQLAEAQALLFSEDYGVQQHAVVESIHRFDNRVKAIVTAAHDERRRGTYRSELLLIGLMAVLFSFWVMAFQTLSRSAGKLLQSNRRLVAQADELARINRTLDRRVEERTQQLETSKQQLEQANEELRRESLQRHQAAQEVHDKATALAQSNGELLQRERVMRSILQDLQAAKEILEYKEQSLQRSNQRLKDLAALKDEFVAKVSHELRTPLTSIKEGLSLLIDNALGPTTDEQQDFLKTMDGDIDRLTELINNMLDLSKIEAGRMRLVRVRCQVRELIESLVRSYQPIAGRRTIQILGGDTVLPVFIDRNRMMQVLSNLFSNAMKFTAETGTIIFRIDHHEQMVRIGVQDNGPGISPEDLPKLFQKFSQVGPQGSGRPRGTGLGLVLCKEIAELHHGRVDVTSQVGQGTTFTVFLPGYSDELAVQESFQELLMFAPADATASIGVIGIKPDSMTAEELVRFVDDVSQNLHRGDVVLSLDDGWVVLLAITDAKGVRAIMGRLRERLAGGRELHVGAALYPGDGHDAMPLLACAKTRLDQPLPESGGSNGTALPTGQRHVG